MAEQDTLIPRRQGGGLMKYRVAPTSTSYLPQVTLVVSDGPFYLQDYLDPQEARNLADLLYKVADCVAPTDSKPAPLIVDLIRAGFIPNT